MSEKDNGFNTERFCFNYAAVNLLFNHDCNDDVLTYYNNNVLTTHAVQL